MANRIVDSARSVINQSPGFGLVLVAETQKGFFLSAELSSTPQGQGESLLPEDLGRKCAHLLLDEIYRVGGMEEEGGRQGGGGGGGRKGGGGRTGGGGGEGRE
ncbi:hypothetical protein CRUP_036185, partial [Coryphaenoides rupestris]